MEVGREEVRIGTEKRPSRDGRLLAKSRLIGTDPANFLRARFRTVSRILRF